MYMVKFQLLIALLGNTLALHACESVALQGYGWLAFAALLVHSQLAVREGSLTLTLPYNHYSMLFLSSNRRYYCTLRQQ